MPYVRSGRGSSKFVPEKRDIIPSEFFLELFNNVDSVLLDNVGKVVPQIADATDAVFRAQGAGTQKPSYPQRSPKAASKKITSGKSSPWATHPGFNQPLFPTEERPGLAGGSRAPPEEEPLPFSSPLSSPSRPRAVTASMPAVPMPDAQAAAPPDSPPAAPASTQNAPPNSGEAASKSSALLRPKDDSMISPQSATDRGASARAGDDEGVGRERCLTMLQGTREEQLKSAVLGTGSRRCAVEAAALDASPARPASPKSSEDDFDEAPAINIEAMMDAPSEEQTFGDTTILNQQTSMRSPKHKYHFVSGDRFTDVAASNFAEALERLRQYLLMKYGSYLMAFRKLEETIDMTGLAGCREAAEGRHMSGMFQYREFTNAVRSLIPNWAEVTGIGNLSKLFKSIDDNDSGYISFEELMGCKPDDDIAHHRFDFCPRSPKQSPFRKQFTPTPWSDSQNKTCTRSESFGATNRFRDQHQLMKDLAPTFTPIFDMPVHHHEEDDGGSSMSSDAHSSDQEIDYDHIKLRLKASGLAMNLNWRKTFQYYDQKNTMEIDWYEFRTIVRKEAQVTPDILTERDLRLLFYSEDVVKETLGDSIFYEKLLEWLEPAPTEEERAVLKREAKYMTTHAQTKHFHKTAHIRALEVERRHVAADHHNHMSCNPCTKMCDMCRGVILVSGWSAHRHGCAEKERRLAEKDQKEIEFLAKCNFSPTISAKAKKTKATSTKELHSGGSPHRFPIRERKDREKAEKYEDLKTCECTFAPKINKQSKEIYRMAHEDEQDIGTRLAFPTPHERMTAKVESKKEGDKEYTPQITVRAIQKGFERSGESVFHRLHHGPVNTATTVDPSTSKSDDHQVHHTTKNLLKCRKPLGISEKAWEKVKQSQQATSEGLIAKRRNEDIEREWGSPGSADIFSPESTQHCSAGSPSIQGDMFSPGSPSIAPLESARSTAAASSVLAQPPYSARSASSSATRATGLTSPGGGVGAFSGKLRASFDKRDSDSVRGKLSPASPAFPMMSALEDDDMHIMSSDNTPDVSFPTHVVVGTTKVMGLLSRCDQVVMLAEKKVVLADSSS